MAYGFNEDKSRYDIIETPIPLPVENGGTGAQTANEALANLGITIGTAVAPTTGTPNTIYIQIV